MPLSLVLHSELQGVIWGKVDSGSRRSRACVNHLDLGLSMPECEHGPLFLLNTSVLHQSLPQCFSFPMALDSAPACSLSGREDMEDFFTWDILLSIWLWFFYLWFFSSLPLAHIGILIAGYTARVISRQSLLDFAVKYRLFYHLLLYFSQSIILFLFSFLWILEKFGSKTTPCWELIIDRTELDEQKGTDQNFSHNLWAHKPYGLHTLFFFPSITPSSTGKMFLVKKYISDARTLPIPSHTHFLITSRIIALCASVYPCKARVKKTWPALSATYSC